MHKYTNLHSIRSLSSISKSTWIQTNYENTDYPFTFNIKYFCLDLQKFIGKQ